MPFRGQSLSFRHQRWPLIISLICLGGAILLAFRPALRFTRLPSTTSQTLSDLRRMTAHPVPSPASPEIRRGSAYFISHGGPPSMYDTSSGAYKAWVRVGQTIQAERPKGIIAVSAHWESDSGDSSVIINDDPTNPLIYDFYGFPAQFYKEKFESHGDAQLLQGIQTSLSTAGIRWKTEKRGPDHGVWVCLKVAFQGKTDIPIIQVSLPGDGSPASTARLGKALGSLRDQGYAVFGGGQVVHNLRDFRMAMSGLAPSLDYAPAFLTAVKSALSRPYPASVDATIALTRHPLYKHAHPTDEHFLPIVFAVAATDGEDELEEVYVSPGDQAGLGWGVWRWH